MGVETKKPPVSGLRTTQNICQLLPPKGRSLQFQFSLRDWFIDRVRGDSCPVGHDIRPDCIEEIFPILVRVLLSPPGKERIAAQADQERSDATARRLKELPRSGKNRMFDKQEGCDPSGNRASPVTHILSALSSFSPERSISKPQGFPQLRHDFPVDQHVWTDLPLLHIEEEGFHHIPPFLGLDSFQGCLATQ